MYRYNDNELLYLINDHSEEAYDILNNKYRPLILSKIKQYNLLKKEAEEYYSEGIICINKAIRTYDSSYYLSFNKYLDLILNRKFIDLNKKRQKNQRIVYLDTIDEYLINTQNEMFINEIDLNLSTFEEKIYQMRFINEQKPREIAKILDCNIKRIYDTIDRIRRKARKKN